MCFLSLCALSVSHIGKMPPKRLTIEKDIANWFSHYNYIYMGWINASDFCLYIYFVYLSIKTTSWGRLYNRGKWCILSLRLNTTKSHNKLFQGSFPNVFPLQNIWSYIGLSQICCSRIDIWLYFFQKHAVKRCIKRNGEYKGLNLLTLSSPQLR